MGRIGFGSGTLSSTDDWLRFITSSAGSGDIGGHSGLWDVQMIKRERGEKWEERDEDR